jgi:hypothetical protein
MTMAYPDAVALIIAYLDSLHAVPVVSRTPSPRPDEWIQVRHIGGAELRPVRDEPRLDVFYWAADEPAAAVGGELVRRELHALAKTSLLGVQCYRVDEVMAPRQFDDPLVTDSYARWATYTLTLRANDAIV